MLKKRKEEKKRIDAMNSSDRDEAIKRLERERLKINGEIENILATYAKESGNFALKPKKRKRSTLNDWNFEV